jgi:excisionase family DNA binding protein
MLHLRRGGATRPVRAMRRDESTMRRQGYCSTCRSSTSRDHYSTDTHRKKVARSEPIADLVGGDGAALARLAGQRARGPQPTDYENALASAKLGGYYGTVIVDEDPDAPNAWYEDMEPPRGEPLTLIEAAGRLGLSPTTLRVQIRNGRLRAVKHGRDWWLTETEVERYRAASLGRRRRTTPPG